MAHTHVTAPTLFVEANGIRYAYRRFREETGVPLLFMQHFRGGLDHWDPAITDGFGRDRPVILFDNAGVASSSGETPGTVEVMPDHARDFVSALGLSQLDHLGFSNGGYVAQAFTSCHPNVVRRLILVGTGPRGGEPATDPNYRPFATATDSTTGKGPLEAFLYLFFSPSPRVRPLAAPSGNDVIADGTMSAVRARHRRWPRSPRPSPTGGKCEDRGSPSSCQSHRRLSS